MPETRDTSQTTHTFLYSILSFSLFQVPQPELSQLLTHSNDANATLVPREVSTEVCGFLSLWDLVVLQSYR